MRENDKDVLAGLHACRWVNERLDDIGVVHVEIPAEDTPENTLKGRNSRALNRACNKSTIIVVNIS